MKADPMPAERVSLMGLFDTQHQTASAIRALHNTGFQLERVHSPIPSHTIAEALNLPKSKVGWFTLAGGILGFCFGFLLAAFTATRWSLIVSGKPIVAWVPFVIVGFEFTILFAVFGNVLGLISQARLPRLHTDQPYDRRLSGHKFGVLVSCGADERGQLMGFFKSEGAEAIGCADDDIRAASGPTGGGTRP